MFPSSNNYGYGSNYQYNYGNINNNNINNNNNAPEAPAMQQGVPVQYNNAPLARVMLPPPGALVEFWGNPSPDYQIVHYFLIGFRDSLSLLQNGLCQVVKAPVYRPVFEQVNPSEAIDQDPSTDNDITLSADEVGYSLSSQAMDIGQEYNQENMIEQFFETDKTAKQAPLIQAPLNQAPLNLAPLNQAPAFNHPQFLNGFMQRVKANRGTKAFIPKRNMDNIRCCMNKPNISLKDWQYAMLHDLPVGMLCALDRIKCIYTTYQLENLPALPKFLFPCALSIPDDVETRYATDRVSKKFMRKLKESKDRMVLELTLFRDGGTCHLFLRPLKTDEAYCEKNLGKNKADFDRVVRESDYPVLSRIKSCKPRKNSAENGVKETETHIKFYSEYGVKIKAPKKET